MALPQGLICTKRVRLGLGEVAFIERGVLTSGVVSVNLPVYPLLCRLERGLRCI